MGTLIEAIHEHKLAEERAAGSIVWPHVTEIVWFCINVLGFMPTAAQTEIMHAVDTCPRVSVRSGRKIGKSRCAAAIGLWRFCRDPDATVILMAPTEAQIVQIVWHDVVNLFNNSGRCLSCRLRNPTGPRPCPHSACIDGDLSASVRTGLRAAGRRMWGMSPRNADHVRGISGRNQIYLTDESSGQADDVHEQTDSNCAGGGNIVAFGQPSNPIGWFAKTFDNPHWRHIHVSSLSTPNIRLHRTIVPNLADDAWAQRKLEQYGADHPVYRSEVLGEPPSLDSRRLLTEVEWSDAVARNFTVPAEGPLVIGLDLASGAEGGDMTTIAIRHGWHMYPVEAFLGGVDRTIFELRSLIRQHRKYPLERVWIPFDCEGVHGRAFRNAAVYLKREDANLEFLPLESGAPGDSDRHILERLGVYNRRTLYAVVAAQWLKTRAGIVDNEELKEEFMFTYLEPDQTRGSRLPDKKMWRRAFNRSPDKMDAVMYCLYGDGVLPPMSEVEDRGRSYEVEDDAAGLQDLPDEHPDHSEDEERYRRRW